MNRLSEPTKQRIEKLFSEYKLKRARAALLMARLEAPQGGSLILWAPKGEPAYEDRLATLADIEREIQAVEIVLAALSKRERVFVELRYGEGFSFPAVARRLGISERSVFRLKERVLAKAAIILGWQENVSSFGEKPVI